MARNVLIVEDEASERDALARLVGHWGYEVETGIFRPVFPVR